MCRYFLAISMCVLFICPRPLVAHEQASATQQEDPEAVFSKIYEHGLWSVNARGEGTSGGGSTVQNARPYMHFIEQFLKEKNIKTIIDLGCGDWEFSQHIDWGDRFYIGYDAVKSVIEKDRRLFGSEHIKFKQADILNMKIPKADLALCKDVLMHLPNRDIQGLLERTRHIKYCLFTNCVSPLHIAPLNLNCDIPLGQFRCLDLSKPPFQVTGRIVLRYTTDHSYKEIFLVEH